MADHGIVKIKDAKSVNVTSRPAAWEWHTLPNAVDEFTHLPDGTTCGFISELPLPFPVTVSGSIHTNIALSLDGYIFLLKNGEDLPSELTSSPFDLSSASLATPHEFIAPYWSDLLAFPTHAGSSIKMAEIAPTNGNRRCVIEYKNLCVTGTGTYADRVSFQIVLTDNPTNNTITVNYNDVATVLNGANAAIGIQRPGGQQFNRISYSFNQLGSVYTGLSLAFALNAGTNPLEADTDFDGIPDKEEISSMPPTDPRQSDTDGDGLGDGWEVDHDMNPIVDNTTDSDPNNDPGADPDGDGLTNYEEYLNKTNPFEEDSDGDGVNDIIEISHGSNPMDGSDQGQPPPQDQIVELPFSIGGDWAAWEMTVTGISGADTRVMKLRMSSPDDSKSVTLKLHKGNSYSVTMSWLGSGSHIDPYWYCWESQIGGLPSSATFKSYEAARLAEVAESFSGPGWFVDNTEGLLTSHVHMKDGGGGNVAGSLRAVLHVVKVESIDVSSARLGDSPNPPPFEGQVEHIVRVDQSPDVDQHAVILYKDAVDDDFNVENFDVTLTAQLAPMNMETDQLTFVWEKVSGPESGELLPSSSLSATFRNPAKGGVYRFRLTVQCNGNDVGFGDANLVLPLAGAEMDTQVQADLVRADAFVQEVKAALPPDRYRHKKFLNDYFRYANMGDYIGRPDNTLTPAVWYYGQLDSSGTSGGNYRLGAVCTWKRRPVRLSKASNFIAAYGGQKLGVNEIRAKLAVAFFITTMDSPTARKSWNTGWDVAKNGGYDAAVMELVDYIWKNEAADDKTKQPWPNPNLPDNYVEPFDENGFQRTIDADRQFSSPGYVYIQGQ